MSASGIRAERRRQRLLADNRCINCAEKLSFDDIGKRQECQRCRDERSARDAERYPSIDVRVTYILVGRHGVPDGYVVMSVEPTHLPGESAK